MYVSINLPASSQLGIGNVQLNVHTTAPASFVEFSPGSYFGKERVFGVKSPFKKIKQIKSVATQQHYGNGAYGNCV